MGEAFVSVATGPDGALWNAAGAATVNRPSLSTSFLDYALDGIHAGSIVFVQPLGRRGSVGAAARYFRAGGIARTTEENPTGEGLGDFSATDIALKLILAFRITDRIFVGGSGAVLSGSIDDSGAVGISSDFGVLWRNVVGRLRIGGAIRHVGAQTTAYAETTDPLPTEFAAGASYPFFTGRLLLAGDYNWSVDRDGSFNSGMEWQVVDDFFLRSGYRSRFSDLRSASEEPGLAGMTFGGGLRKIRSYAIDYAYASLGDLGGTHRFTFTWDFR